MALEISNELQNVEARIKAIEADLPRLRGVRRFPPFNEKSRNIPENGQEPVDEVNVKKRPFKQEEDDDYYQSDEEPQPKRSVESTVEVPQGEPVSREKKIEELSKKETKEGINRNRRLFANLMGALSAPKKTDLAAARQAKKLQEVEQRLEENKRLDKEKAIEEKQARIQKAKESEVEMAKLVRKKAMLQYAENKVAHYELMKNAIQTKTLPIIFYAPAKHTVRSLELLKASQQTIDVLIQSRKELLQAQLEASDREPAPRRSREFAPRRLSLPTPVKCASPNRNRSKSFSRSRSNSFCPPRSKSFSRSRSPEEEEDEQKPDSEEIQVDAKEEEHSEIEVDEE